MTSKTMALSIAIVLGAASAASALEGRDSDNNPVPAARAFVQRSASAFIGSNTFAAPRFALSRSAAGSSNWDRCARLACVH